MLVLVLGLGLGLGLGSFNVAGRLLVVLVRVWKLGPFLAFLTDKPRALNPLAYAPGPPPNV